MRIFGEVDNLRVGLDYHVARHNLLVSNLSHVDTPGYRPLDLERVDFGAVMTQLEATQEGHFGAPAGTQGASVSRVFADPAPVAGPDGNAVSLDREAVKIASNQVRYDVVAQLVTGALSGLAWAASDGRGGG